MLSLHVPPALDARNRLTTLVRPILAIPHLILVGVPLLTLGGSASTGSNPDHAAQGAGFSGGLFGVAVLLTSIVSWIAIVVTGRQPRALWDFAQLYVAWRARSNAYLMLLCDEYPPFGDGPYPVQLAVAAPEERNRLTVAFRLLLALPHLIALVFLGVAWSLATFVAWLVILFTGRHPESLFQFGAGVLRWSTRYEVYVLLLRDEYPPFSLE